MSSLIDVTGALARALEDALPQTQCTRCGYPDCRGYAQAIAAGEAEINQCPPGGEEGIARLAALTGRPAVPLNPAHGHESARQLAVIDEDGCIGCTLCLQACPVDSIVGGPKAMHTVIAAQCTGCELCLPACPVDCIALVPVNGGRPQADDMHRPPPEGEEETSAGRAFPHERTGWQAWSDAQAREARERFAWHRQRLERDELERVDRLARCAPDEPAVATDDLAPPVDPGRIAAAAALALARARAARGI